MTMLKRYLVARTTDSQRLDEELREIIKYRHWEVRGHPSLDAYLQAEIGLTQLELTERIRLAQHGGDRRSAKAKENQGDNITLKRGDQAIYVLERLRRYPALAQRVRAGELSAHRAAIMAGIRHPKLTVRADDVLKAVRTLIKRYGLAAVLKACDECRE
jgi:hypothetical protein